MTRTAVRRQQEPAFSRPLRLGVARERSGERRAPLTPHQCAELLARAPHLHVVVEPSPERCFADREYARAGCTIADDLRNCDLVMSIKVPAVGLTPGVAQLLFSHTHKMQPEGRELLRSALEGGTTLIDYELITDDDGKRSIALGWYAGLVGTWYGLQMAAGAAVRGTSRDSHELESVPALVAAAARLQLHSLKVVVTGGGRVAAGAINLLERIGGRRVQPDAFAAAHTPSGLVYTQLAGADLYRDTWTGDYQREHFRSHPGRYASRFAAYTRHADVLVNGVYWQSGHPRLFELDEIGAPDFRLRHIADVTCDRFGSVPITVTENSFAEPFSGFHRHEHRLVPAFSRDAINVMAIANLPCAIPQESSAAFGRMLLEHVLPGLTRDPIDAALARATLMAGGQLTPRYRYLERWVSSGVVDQASTPRRRLTSNW